MIRSKAKLHKSIPLFFLLASAASLAAASDLPEKRRFREEIQKLSAVAAAPAAHSSAADRSAVPARSDRPARNADRGRDGRGDDNGRHGNHSRGDSRGGRRHDADRGRGGHDGRRHDADRGRDNRRWDNDGRRDSGRRDDRYRDNGRRDNGRRDDRWQNDGRRSDWGHDGRHDRYDRHDRRDRWEHHSRYGRRWDGHRWHGPRHNSWDHGYRGLRAWHNLHLRNGFYFGLGSYLDYRFSVPTYMAIDYDPSYEEYYYGTVYHPGYGRDFEVFLFPTYYGDRVEYIPHAYAEGRLFGRGRIFSGGGSGISIRFDF